MMKVVQQGKTLYPVGDGVKCLGPVEEKDIERCCVAFKYLWGGEAKIGINLLNVLNGSRTVEVGDGRPGPYGELIYLVDP